MLLQCFWVWGSGLVWSSGWEAEVGALWLALPLDADHRDGGVDPSRSWELKIGSLLMGDSVQGHASLCPWPFRYCTVIIISSHRNCYHINGKISTPCKLAVVLATLVGLPPWGLSPFDCFTRGVANPRAEVPFSPIRVLPFIPVLVRLPTEV